ncbi:hypothetical protein R9C00_03315 [Flammeovirgaceae bacterium SG7u.111]|nr:hypothetical protein R9C00_03315 [Flammeovirgaceae bacterium SG7u.111]
MTNDIKINEYLEKIFASESFGYSTKNRELLKFLVEAAVRGNYLQEYAIGREIFGETYDPVKNDTKVKMYVYNLRKKLDEYYKEEGKYDSLKFQIEQGTYNVEFVNNKTINPPLIDSNTKSIGYLTFIFLFLISIGYIYLLTSKDLFSYNLGGRFWIGYFHSEKPNLVYMGDYHGLGTIATSDSSQAILPQPESENNDVAYLTKLGPFATYYLLQWFIKNNSEFELRLANQTKEEELLNSNCIFVGQPNTMGKFEKTFTQYNPQYKLGGGKITYTHPKSGKKILYQSKVTPTLNTDYALVSRLPGNNDAVYTYFMSPLDVGSISVIQYFTENDSLNSFYDGVPEDIEFFTALFKISGKEKEAIKFELLHFDPVVAN